MSEREDDIDYLVQRKFDPDRRPAPEDNGATLERFFEESPAQAEYRSELQHMSYEQRLALVQREQAKEAVESRSKLELRDLTACSGLQSSAPTSPRLHANGTPSRS